MVQRVWPFGKGATHEAGFSVPTNDMQVERSYAFLLSECIIAFRLFVDIMKIDAKNDMQLTDKSRCDINAVEEGIPLVTFPLPPQNGTVFRENSRLRR